MIALYLIAFSIMQNVISYHLNMNTNSFTQTHTHTNTPVHTLAFHLHGLSISRMPPTCTHMSPTHTRTNTCTDTHIPVAGGNTHFTAMATAKLTQFPWRWRRGRLLAPETHPFFLLIEGGMKRWEVRQKDADRGMT